MKNRFIIFLLFISSLLSANTYYVATTGKDLNLGTFDKPWATWQKAFETAQAGDTVYFRGGIYRPSGTYNPVRANHTEIYPSGGIGHNGTEGNPICYFAYPNDYEAGNYPILDCSQVNRPNWYNTGLVMIEVNFLHFKGLTIRNVWQKRNGVTASGVMAAGITVGMGFNLTFENMNINNIAGRAIGVTAAVMNHPELATYDTTRFINCDFYDLCDSLCASTDPETCATSSIGGLADGIKVDSYGGSHIIIRGCRIWHFGDNGIDLSSTATADIDSCWTWRGGDFHFTLADGPYEGEGTGIKYGDLRTPMTRPWRSIRHCISAYNSFLGFDENNSGSWNDPLPVNVYNNTSFKNRIGFGNFSYTTGRKILSDYKNNISYLDRTYERGCEVNCDINESYNSWDSASCNAPLTKRVFLTDEDFLSLDSTQLYRPRKANGNLPDIDFLELSSTSNAIDRGTDTDLAYYGSAPDIGAFEYWGTNSNQKMVTGISVTGAGGVKSINTNKGTLQLLSIISPNDATNNTVTWSITNGSNLASINAATGLVTAINDGVITVRATANDGTGVYGTLTITITNQVIRVVNITVVGDGGVSLITSIGATLQLIVTLLPANATNKAVTWSISSGTDKATISSTGLVTALDNGTAIARATANDGTGVYGTLVITISNQVIPSTSIAVTGGSAIATDGGTLQLSALVQPANATNKAVTWSISSGTDKATISSTGLVTALDNGTAIARATANDGTGVYGTLTITLSNQTNVSIINEPPLIVVNYKPSSYSGFVSEINASGTYDNNKDNLTFLWITPNNLPVSSISGSTLRYLSPNLITSQIIQITLKVSDGKTTQSKVIPIEILPYKPDLEVAEISNIESSSYQPPFSPYNVIDGNIGTMWSADGDSNQWLIIELKQSFEINHVKLAFQPGQRKESYFDLLGSKDKIYWEPILNKTASCDFSGDIQVFEFPASKTGKEFNYVKLIGRGNSQDTWNYISELKVFGYRHRNTLSFENLPVKVYPNPAKKFVNLRIDQSTLIPEFIQLIDLSGMVLLQEKLDPNLREFTIPLNLKNGTYIIKLGTNKVIFFTQKLIIAN
jgi:uncharacterized protein YjdB